jgi:hypothetical protein
LILAKLRAEPKCIFSQATEDKDKNQSQSSNRREGNRQLDQGIFLFFSELYATAEGDLCSSLIDGYGRTINQPNTKKSPFVVPFIASREPSFMYAPRWQGLVVQRSRYCGYSPWIESRRTPFVVCLENRDEYF